MYIHLGLHLKPTVDNEDLGFRVNKAILFLGSTLFAIGSLL